MLYGWWFSQTASYEAGLLLAHMQQESGGHTNTYRLRCAPIRQDLICRAQAGS